MWKNTPKTKQTPKNGRGLSLTLAHLLKENIWQKFIRHYLHRQKLKQLLLNTLAVGARQFKLLCL